ncbi:DUF4767 domain-containing protein [Limosilactobacillus sp.]|uniref:DUF4767 domain-containing protein n=1 Tax=Limosilactobacillus sp. TaxID=2773925 RepID=UPI0035A171E1
MKGRKILLGVATILVAGVLTACGNQTSQGKQSADHGQATSRQSTSQQSSSQVAHQTVWSHQQDQQLTTFINNWAPKMHQSYQKYDGTNQLKTSVGVTYPADLSREQVNGQAGVMGWAPTGKGDYEYNVVAIYNYDGTEPPLPNRITYFFCFHNGKPVALVDQTRDGEPSAHPTINQDIRDNFARIANEH